MVPSFNTAGPCVPEEHYMLPPGRRLDEVLELIRERKFFTLHAGRQTGKTTSLLWLERYLNASAHLLAVWVDIEIAREDPDVARAMRTVLGCIDRALSLRFPEQSRPNEAEVELLLRNPKSALLNYITWLATAAPRPLVILFDEADGLVGEAMVSFLTQLRDGYIGRRAGNPFAASVALVGQRQVRDYALREEERRAVAWLGTTSPFNVTSAAMTLSAFNEPEVAELLAQHTAATGQRFEPSAAARIYELGQGHPWLTNALADEIVRKIVRDRGVTITAEHVDAAKETIILERRTHIDSLIARLREPRVRRILDPMLVGERAAEDTLDDDFAYVLGLGLIRLRKGVYEIANPIYREVIPRALSFNQQVQIRNEPAWYVRGDGSLDMDKLMAHWQVFWRKDGHLAAAGFAYREAGPHLMLMAFLQRVVNGGGRVEREYGLGRGALDLMIHWKEELHAIEVKLRRDTETEAEALDQVAGYLDGLGLSEGWLVMFDLRKEPPWAEKLFRRDERRAGKVIHLVGA